MQPQANAMAKVEAIEKNEAQGNTVFIDIHFTQYDIEAWKKVLGEYVKNQEEINKIIMRQHELRGEE
jgi:hypothetical protein